MTMADDLSEDPRVIEAMKHHTCVLCNGPVTDGDYCEDCWDYHHWKCISSMRKKRMKIEKNVKTLPPEAFKNIDSILSNEWEDRWSGHCYVCHIANSKFIFRDETKDYTVDNIATDPISGEWLEDYFTCGPHCKNEH